MAEISSNAAGRGFWLTAIFALLWNLVGLMTYVMTVTLSEEVLATMPEAERALYTNIPVWVTAAYGIAVVSGVLACCALLLRRVWAVPLFLISLLAILVQMSHTLLGSQVLAVQGPAGLVLPLMIIVVAVYLLWFARSANQRGQLR